LKDEFSRGAGQKVTEGGESDEDSHLGS